MMAAATQLIGSLLKKHMVEIDKAYLKAPDAFKVGIKLAFKPAGEEISMEASIEFTTDKIKDSIKGQMREGQEGLFKQSKKGEEAETAAAQSPEDKPKAIAPKTPELTAGDSEVIEAEFEDVQPKALEGPEGEEKPAEEAEEEKPEEVKE